MSTEKMIALCLSGGGLRATLFHLGLVKALRNHSFDGTPALQCVSEIYSVSGGSILAAHMVRNWSAYIGDDDAFAAVEKRLLAFARRNVRDRVLRRWALPAFSASRGKLLQAEYRALVGSGTIGEGHAAAGKPPRVYILATSFKTGELCSFSADRFEIMRRAGKELTTIAADGSRVPLAYAAAASSAFPPMFPPLALTPTMVGADAGEEFREPVYLSDGGVYDNLGFEKFLSNQALGVSRATMLIGSNAGGSFRTEAKSRFAGIFSRNVRASDIMMRRVLESTEDAIQRLADVDYVPVKIGDTHDDPALPADVQRELRSVRTDLDYFGPALAQLLVDHGCRIGTAALTGQGAALRGDVSAAAASADPEKTAKIARGAAKRSFWSLFLDFRDWTLPILWAAALALGYYGYATVRESRRAAALEKQAEKDKWRVDFADEIWDAYSRGDAEKVASLLGREGRKSNPFTDAEPDGARPAPPPPPTAPAAGGEPALPAAAYRQKVYIQFAGSLKREQIVALNRRLAQAGWAVQGSSGERIGTAAGRHEIRYSADNRAAAEALARAIDDAAIIRAPVTTRALPIISRDVLEIWISN